MKLIKYLIYLNFIFIMMNSCVFYSTKGTIPSHINSIYIQPILNKSSDQEMTDILDQSLNNILISENILEIINYEDADSKIEVTILEVIDIPYTISNENEFEDVNDWKLSVKVNVVWLDFEKGETLFDNNISEWAIYGTSLDINSDGLDNDGDGLIDSEDSDEIGVPRDAAKLIAANKIVEKILIRITSIW